MCPQCLCMELNLMYNYTVHQDTSHGLQLMVGEGCTV